MLQRPTPSNVSAATEFFQTQGPTNVCTPSNDGNRAGSHLTSSNHEALGRFAEAKDRRGDGVYFCVSTLKNEKLIHIGANREAAIGRIEAALSYVVLWGALDGLTLGKIGAAPFGVQ
jgi:hypothetical protein